MSNTEPAAINYCVRKGSVNFKNVLNLNKIVLAGKSCLTSNISTELWFAIYAEDDRLDDKPSHNRSSDRLDDRHLGQRDNDLV